MNNKDHEEPKVVEAAKSSQGDPCTGSLVCPRCGRIADNLNLQRPVMSRYAEINICSVCGFEEAMLGDILPLRRWHEKSLQGYMGEAT